MKKIIFTALILMATLTACDKFLGIEPKGVKIPQDYNDYEMLMNRPQQFQATDPYPCFMTDDAFLPYEDVANEFPMYTKKIGLPGILNYYRFYPVTMGELPDNNWSKNYENIYYYNVVMDEITKVKDATNLQKQHLKAEALLGRAYTYLNLINLYAKHYDKATAYSDLGVPLLLDKNLEKGKLSRATVQVVYDRILKDLQDAEALLPLKPKNASSFRGSAIAAKGVLARAYLYMGDYENARKKAKEVLEVKNELLNLRDYKYDDSKQASRITMPQMTENPENIYTRITMNTADEKMVGLSALVYGSESLMKLYDKNDYRKELFFARKFNGKDLPDGYFLWMPSIKMNNGITTAEMMLIVAECEARIGDMEAAMQMLDKLAITRTKDPKKHVTLTAKDNEEALDITLKERRKEMAFLDIMRLIDLKRLNKEDRYKTTITHITEENSFTLLPDSKRYVLPIPPAVLRFNTPTMKPNER